MFFSERSWFRKAPILETGGDELARLRRENELLREVLTFYASAQTWNAGYKYRDPDDATIFTDGSESGATVDKGDRARRVMAVLKKQQQQ